MAVLARAGTGRPVLTPRVAVHDEGRFAGKTVGIVLCGGNIDTRLLANVLLRDLARSGRLARLRIRLQDQPGALYNVARIFDQERVNILELAHQVDEYCAIEDLVRSTEVIALTLLDLVGSPQLR